MSLAQIVHQVLMPGLMFGNDNTSHVLIYRAAEHRMLKEELRKLNLKWNKTDMKIYLPNGSSILFVSSDNLDRLRGLNFDSCIIRE